MTASWSQVRYLGNMVRFSLIVGLMGLFALLAPLTLRAEVPGAESLLAAQQLKKNLNSLPAIRVFINRAPGFGHQAASVHVIKRLRELGFENEIEVVYHIEMKSKLEILLPGFQAQGADDQQLTILGGLKVVSNTFFAQKMKRRMLPLGITGADDSEVAIPKYLQVDNFIKLQPAGWNAYNELIETRSNTRIPLDDLDHLGVLSPMPLIENLNTYLEAMSAVPSLAHKAAGVQTLLQRDPQLKMMSLYGMSDGGFEKYVTVLSAIHQLQTKRSMGPVVVPVLSRLTETTMQRLQVRLPGFNLMTASVADADLSSKMSALSGQQILLVQVGGLTQDLFELMLQSSNLPPTVAGKNAVHFMKRLGKPYLSTIAEMPARMEINSDMAAYTIWQAFGAMISHMPSVMEVDVIANFIDQSQQANSKLNHYFEKFAAEASEDKLERALQLHFRLEEAVSENKSKSPCNDLLKAN